MAAADSGSTVCRTVRQYSQAPLAEKDMEKLVEIAGDCCMVKNEVYARYGGIGGLSKIYPGYTVQNEMTKTGLRQRLGLPSVYFYLAVFDALGDIKSQWSRTKSRVLRRIGKNDRFTARERHYLRFVLKTGSTFAAVLQQTAVRLPSEIQKKYDLLAGETDAEKLNRYLCSQVRKCHRKLHTEKADGFSAAERAYRYGDHGIYLSTKENRRRIFVPLTDQNQYRSQIYVKLHPKEGHLEIHVPIKVSVRKHEDYTNQVGAAMGMFTMLTTDGGHRYGEELGELQSRYAEWMRHQTGSYNRNRADNPGRKKYYARKNRYEERLHSYMNHELNRFLETEKPGIIYMAKLPKPQAGGVNKTINNQVTMWQRGYIRRRLEQKCKEQSIELVEVLGKNISRECSCCGAEGIKKEGRFSCPVCGWEAEEKTNTARNALRRGVEGKVVY